MKYTCAMCKAVCESEWTDEEATAELRRDFGSVPLEECDVVCDKCYQEISPANNPEYNAAYTERAPEKHIFFNTPLPTQTVLDDTEAIRAYVDAELCRKLGEWMDQEYARDFLGFET